MTNMGAFGWDVSVLMIRGESIDKVYYELSKEFARISIENKLIWEEAKIVLDRMLADIQDNLLEAFWVYKMQETPSKAVDFRSSPYH